MGAPCLDGRLEIFDRLGADAVEFEHLVEVEGVEVGDAMSVPRLTNRSMFFSPRYSTSR